MGAERTTTAGAGANMWALLQDNDPGHDASAVTLADNVVDKQAAKRSKKTKKKKGNGDKMTKETGPPSKEEEEGEMNGTSRCRAVASRIYRAAVVGTLLALLCHLTSAPPVAAGYVV